MLCIFGKVGINSSPFLLDLTSCFGCKLIFVSQGGHLFSKSSRVYLNLYKTEGTP